ncbi:uncharacterized protein LOC144618198 [Crassostrea virginica]
MLDTRQSCGPNTSYRSHTTCTRVCSVLLFECPQALCNDDQRSLPGQDAAAGSVAPYPPLRLVPSRGQLPLHHENDDSQNVFSVGPDGLGQPSWMRIPPSMMGKKITIIIK